MSSTSEVPPPVDNRVVNQVRLRSFRRLQDRLVKLWRSDRTRGLETRHQTGVLLNKRLGPPKKRQPYGQQELKSLGEVLKISESELSRMRWFAHLVHDPNNFFAGGVKIESWTQCKEVLPSLMPQRGRRTGKPSAGSSRALLKGCAKSLENVSSKLRRLDNQPEGEDRALFCERLRELIEVASGHLRIRALLVVDDVPIPDPVSGHEEGCRSDSDGDRTAGSMPAAVPA